MSKRVLRLDVGGLGAAFSYEPITRATLYGQRLDVRLDPYGQTCKEASITGDGILLRKGMKGRAHFDDEGNPLSSKEVVALDDEGNPLEVLPSTLDSVQKAEVADPFELMLARIGSVHHLSPFEDIDEEILDNLKLGTIYKIPYRYRPHHETKTAWLIANEHGVFALIGKPTEPDWCADLDVVDDGDIEPFQFGGIL